MNYRKSFNISLIISSLCFFFVVLSTDLKAQSSGKKHIYRESGFNVSDQQVQSNVRLNEINTLAFRHFRKNNPLVEHEYWEKTQQGFTVRFKDADKVSLAYYDNQGAFLYSVKYFEESELNNELQKRLRREYPGFQFDILTEINNDIKTIYLVTLKNKYSMKSLLIEQGEIRVIDDLNYAGL
jgi:hypothetical protein